MKYIVHNTRNYDHDLTDCLYKIITSYDDYVYAELVFAPSYTRIIFIEHTRMPTQDELDYVFKRTASRIKEWMSR